MIKSWLLRFYLGVFQILIIISSIRSIELWYLEACVYFRKKKHKEIVRFLFKTQQLLSFITFLQTIRTIVQNTQVIPKYPPCIVQKLNIFLNSPSKHTIQCRNRIYNEAVSKIQIKYYFHSPLWKIKSRKDGPTHAERQRWK